MILESLHIDGFGKLYDVTLNFHPKLNLVFGSNEAGKSTLQQTILHLLFGFFQRARATPEEKKQWQRFHPWTVDHYGGYLIYSLSNGQRFLVKRDFSNEDIPTHLYDELTGEEITHRFSVRRHGNVAFLREQIGMTRELFEATCFVRQAQVKSISGNEHLINEVISILDSGSEGKSAKGAVQRLEAEILAIGTDRSRKKPLNRARDRLQELEAELAACMQVRAELRDAVGRQKELEKLVEKSARKRFELNYLVLTRQIETLESRINQLRSINKERKQVVEELETLKQAERFSDEKRDELLKRWQTRVNLRDQLTEKQANLSERREQLSQLEKEIAPLKSYEQIVSLLPYEKYLYFREDWSARHEELQKASTAVQKEEIRLLQQGLTLDVLREIGSLQAEDIEDFSKQEKELAALQNRVAETEQQLDTLEATTWAKRNLRWPLILTPVFLALILFTLAVVVPFPAGFPLAAAVLIVGLLINSLYRSARKRLGKQADALQDEIHTLRHDIEMVQLKVNRRNQRYQVKSALELVDRKEQFREYHNLLRDRDKVKADLEQAEFQLKKYLQPLRVHKIHEEILQQIDSEFSQFSRLYDQKKELQKQIEQLEDQIKQVEKRIRENDEELKELFEKLELEIEDLEQGEQIVQQLSEERKRFLTLKKRKEALEAKSQGLLMNDSEESLHRSLEDLISRREKLMANHPYVSGRKTSKSVETLQKEFNEVDQQYQAYEKEKAALRSRIDTILRQHRPQAEIEEDIAAVRAEVARLEELRSVLEIARDRLTQVAQNYHRNVVPFLNETLSGEMKRITGGRYTTVRVNPDALTVNLQVPEKAELSTSDVLSLGTQEQLYLLLRVALARLLSRNMEPLPFLLDDPFVHFDHQRLENVLKLTAEMSRDNQILLFTKDSQMISWCRENLNQDDYLLIDLAELNGHG